MSAAFEMKVLMLSSWKEIAQYLDKDVKTVREWEKKGLPVRHTSSGGVCIGRADLNAWLLSHNDAEREVEQILMDIKRVQHTLETIANEIEDLAKRCEEENPEDKSSHE